ncbi:MAG: AzlC family ABC transporter permease [Eubacterium sp.]|nr:AzlC family ABC transporter permease [Candidatus Colimonas fimequi]
MEDLELDYRRGLKDGIPIALGYFSVSTAFGLIAVDSGCTAVEALFISMFNVTSAGQFAGVTILASMGTYIEMALAQFLINARYALMAISLSQKINDKFRGVKRLALATFITDEIFAVAIGQDDEVSAAYYGGLSTLPWFGWAGGTFFGAVLGNIMPDILSTSLSIALYGMFIAIVVPPAKANFKVLIAVAIAIACSCILFYVPVFDGVSSGFAIIISAVIASAIGALLFPVDDEDGGDAA